MFSTSKASRVAGSIAAAPPLTCSKNFKEVHKPAFFTMKMRVFCFSTFFNVY